MAIESNKTGVNIVGRSAIEKAKWLSGIQFVFDFEFLFVQPIKQPIDPLLPTLVEALEQFNALSLVDDGVVDRVVSDEFEVPQ